MNNDIDQFMYIYIYIIFSGGKVTPDNAAVGGTALTNQRISIVDWFLYQTNPL